MASPRFRLLARAEQAPLLALPWGLPLEDWPENQFVEVERGIGRHVVRFVELQGRLFALKELPPPLAAREYHLLTELDIAEGNLAGELYDLSAELERDVVEDPFAFAAGVRTGYEELWDELTRDEVFRVGEGNRLEQRLRRLNELGFDVDEVELVSSGDEVRLLLHSKVVEPGHHRRRLLRLTGLDAQENQARRLLNDLTRYRAWLERSGKAPVSEAAAAGKWLSEVFEPSIAAVPAELQAKRAAAAIFHELLAHRWFLSEQAGQDG